MQISQYSNQNPVGIYLVNVNSLNIFQQFKNFENVNFELILLIVVFIVGFEHVNVDRDRFESKMDNKKMSSGF